MFAAIPVFLVKMIQAAATPLAEVAIKMLVSSLGYKFICKTAVITAKAFAKTTENKYDDQVADAWAEALDVEVSDSDVQ